ncbi:MAG: Na+/H+ antiporter NhaA [Acidimicrobiales bacterium]|nr:Na+/H+ antiporter NhaA [Acidimicrobiales bacterium]
MSVSTDPHTVRRRWSESDRLVPRAFVQPAQRFMATEAAGGSVMLVAAAVALIWANSPWHATYEHLWTTPLEVRLGGVLHIDQNLQEWVNSALMALFFLLAGLEIKRQLVLGELRDPKAAALPAMAALGGMVVPALIFFAINAGSAGERGWGIPMATDIAFAVGVVSLAGRRIPSGARVFILTLAVVDDIGGILVIAVFYATDVQFAWLGVAALAVLLAVGAQRNDVRSIAPYLVLGAVTWLALLQAGVEAAIAGVVFGLLCPAWPFHDPGRFGDEARRMVDAIERSRNGGLTDDQFERNEVRIEALTQYALETTSPLERVESRLNPWVAFLIVPLFAFANAGVHIGGTEVVGSVAFGVGIALVVGKTVGVFGASAIAVRLGIGRLPDGAGWRHVLGLAVTSGIGFTVALFVTTLAFTDDALTASAKIGILAGSLVAGCLGFVLLRSLPLPETARAPSAARPA